MNSTVDLDLQTICLTCLEKRIEKRYETAADLAQDLQRYLDGDSIAARPHGFGREIWHWSRRSQRAPQAATVVLLIAAFYGLCTLVGICVLLFDWVPIEDPGAAAMIVSLDAIGFALCLPAGLGILAGKRLFIWGGLLVAVSMVVIVLGLVLTGYSAGGLLSDPFQRIVIYTIFGFVGCVMTASCVVALLSHYARAQNDRTFSHRHRPPESTQPADTVGTTLDA